MKKKPIVSMMPLNQAINFHGYLTISLLYYLDGYKISIMFEMPQSVRLPFILQTSQPEAIGVPLGFDIANHQGYNRKTKRGKNTDTRI